MLPYRRHAAAHALDAGAERGRHKRYNFCRAATLAAAASPLIARQMAITVQR